MAEDAGKIKPPEGIFADGVVPTIGGHLRRKVPKFAVAMAISVQPAPAAES